MLFCVGDRITSGECKIGLSPEMSKGVGHPRGVKGTLEVQVTPVYGNT